MKLNISKLYEIFDYIPLEYINIKKVNNNSFVIEYAFPLLFSAFKKYYYGELVHLLFEIILLTILFLTKRSIL